MAQNVTRTKVWQFGDTRAELRYSFAVGDEWDTWDPWDIDQTGPDEGPLSLVGDIEVEVIGPGIVFVEYWRWQGNSKRPWRSGTLTAGDGVQAWPAGSGPNPRTVADLAGGEATRTG